MEKKPESQINASIAEALAKINETKTEKEGVNLLDITKKLSEKKFGKK